MGRGRILVVDDEVDHLKLLRMILRREFDVQTASSGAEALEFVHAQPPDLIIADQRMPGMSGLELLAYMRDKHPDTIRILLTAYSDAGVLKDAINAAGVYRYVTKPWDPELLRIDLRRALEHRQSSLQLRRAENLAVLGGLAGAVAHDLKGVLSPFVLAPTLLRESRASADEVAQLLERATEAAQGLAEELLSISKGRPPELRKRPQQLRLAVEGALSLCRGSELDSVAVGLDLEDLPELPLATDRVMRLVSNLLLNAAQSAGDGGRVQVTTQTSEGGQEVRVEDDGPGVPEALREQIFDPLVTTRGDGGHGLGQATARAVMAGHGGTLVVDDSPLGGARFVARFPEAG